MEQFVIGKEEIKEMAANVRKEQELFFPHIIKSAQEKNLWIAQVITIASAIVGGGFLLFQRQENLVICFGLGLLFVIVFVGLILIYRGNKDFEGRLIEAYGKFTDYGLRAIEYYMLLGKQDLTDVDKSRQQQLENYFLKFFKEFGIIGEDGTVGGVEKKLLENNKKSDVGAYFLIFGFLVAGLILIFANYIPKIMGFFWNFCS